MFAFRIQEGRFTPPGGGVKPETNNRFKINDFEFYMLTASSVNKRSRVNEQTSPDEVMINKVDTLGNASCQK